MTMAHVVATRVVVAPDGFFTTSEVMARTGTTSRQLNYWVNRGYIEGQESIGSGQNRAWSPQQVERVREIKRALEDCAEILERAELPFDFIKNRRGGLAS